MKNILTSLLVISLFIFGSLALFNNVSAATCVNLTADMSVGSEDFHYATKQVTNLQNFLVSRGLMSVAPNGYFGPSTLAGVKSFQVSNGIDSTGFVGVVTRTKIKEITCDTSFPLTPPPPPVVVNNSGMSINAFVQFLMSLGYITPDRIPAVNTFLLSVGGAPLATSPIVVTPAPVITSGGGGGGGGGGGSSPTYIVTYNGNGNTGGSVPTDSGHYRAGSSVTAADNTGSLIRTGYIFKGWNTAANGSGTSYATSSTFSMSGSNMILYAVWAPVYTITYNGNGSATGTVPTNSNSYETGATTTVADNTGSLAKTDYIFSGWNTAANGSGTSYATSSTLTIGSADVVLYAVWTFVFAGGDGSLGDPYQISSWSELNRVRNYLSSNFILNNDLSSNQCYQESADQATVGDGSCTLDYSGSYSSSNAGAPISLFDGDWSTYAFPTSLPGSMIANAIYKKPASSTGAIWKVKYKTQSQDYTVNVDVPSECFLSSVDLKYTHYNDGGSNYTRLSCNNGSDYTTIYDGASDSGIFDGMYEEGIYWKYSSDYYGIGDSFAPIGSNIIDNLFEGNFNGNNKNISDLIVNIPSDAGAGLFGFSSGGDISNLGLINANITGLEIVGAIAGAKIGGTILNCYSIRGTITGSGIDTSAGGLVGEQEGGTISGSYSSGSVSGNDTVGGLVGSQAGLIINSYSTASVTASYPSTGRVGGLVGLQTDSNSVITNSYSTGSVSGYSGSESIGGFVGENWSNSGTTTNSYWDIETSGTSTSAGGTGTTTAVMKNINTFTNATWDMVATTTDLNNGYPFLGWQAGDNSQVWYVPTHLILSINSGTPAAANIIASDGAGRNEADNIVGIIFNVKAENSGVLIDNLTINATGTARTAGQITIAHLYDGITEIGNAAVSASTTEGITFSDLMFLVDKDTTEALTVKFDIRNATSSPHDITFSLTNAGITTYSQVRESITGSAQGDTMTIVSSGPVLTLTSKNLTKSTSVVDSTSTVTYTGTFNFRVLAGGQDIIIGRVASSSPFAATTSFAIYEDGVLNATPDGFSALHTSFNDPSEQIPVVSYIAPDNILIADGNEVDITVTVTVVLINPASGHNLSVQVKDILGLTYMANLAGWRTNSI